MDATCNHLVLHRLIQIKSNDDNETIDRDVRIAETIEDLQDPWIVENLKNGRYYYQKLLLPTNTHTPPTSRPYMYYSERYGEVVIINSDETETRIDPGTDDGFDQIYDLVNGNLLDNCFLFDDELFNIYSLVQCYLLNERTRINNFLKNNCWGGCSGTKDLDTKSDILLAAIAVLSDLIEKREFFEAQRILDNLNTCGHLCKDFKETLKGCGCGKD